MVSVSKLQDLSVYSEILNNIVCLKLKCMLLFDTYIFVIEQWEWKDGHPSGQCHLWEKGRGFAIKEEYTGPSPGPGEFPFFSWVVGSCLSIMLLLVLFVCLKYFTIFCPFFPLITPKTLVNSYFMTVGVYGLLKENTSFAVKPSQNSNHS